MEICTTCGKARIMPFCFRCGTELPKTDPWEPMTIDEQTIFDSHYFFPAVFHAGLRLVNQEDLPKEQRWNFCPLCREPLSE